jgi:SAM-dependent methyltransferase
MVALLDPQPGEAVLDLAAGVGETGYLAVQRLAPGGSLLTTDLVPEMVEAARRRARELGLADVSFAVADAQALDLTDGSIDGVLCRFGLMLVPEPLRALVEMARVLRPGGRAVLAVWADADRNDWATAGGRAALALGLAERPDPDAPGPFRLSDPARTRALVAGAGLRLVHEEEVPVEWRYPSLEGWWEATSDLSRATRQILAAVGREEADAVRHGAFDRLASYVAGDGSLTIPGVARVLLAHK